MKNFFFNVESTPLHLAVICAAVILDYVLGCFIYIAIVNPTLLAGFIHRHAFAEPTALFFGVLAPVLSIAAWKSFKNLG